MLSNGNEIKRVNENVYRVKSQSGNGFYLVSKQGEDWACECPDFVHRQVACKHIYATYFSLNFREHVTSKNLALDIASPDVEQWVWLWHLMDGDTRFLLANHVSQGRTVADAREAFKEAKSVAKTDARVLLTDGLESYKRAAEKEFPNAGHVSGIGIQGRVNNNRIERYHGTFKERSKVMRAIKKPDSSFIEGQRIYYNYLRPHTALEGKTPAEAAGIELNLEENKWKSLISQSAKHQKKDGEPL